MASPRPAGKRPIGTRPVRRPPTKPRAPQRRWLPWLILVAVLAAAGGGAYTAYTEWKKRSAPAATLPVESTVAVTAPPAAAASIPRYSVEQLLQERTEGDWLVHRLSEAPSILVVEFPDLRTQGLTLNRIAALLEKARGRRDRVLTDAELGNLLRATGDTVSTFYFGHDYPGGDLARFYTLARAQGVGLNPQELRLLRLLLDAGLVVDDGHGQYQPVGANALISFSAVQSATAADSGAHIDAMRRRSILGHELSHGRYYTDPAYRQHCEFFWRQLMTEEERRTWRRYLGHQGYDSSNEDLMINETQALLMHTSDTRDFSADALKWKDADLEGLRQRFRLGWSG